MGKSAPSAPKPDPNIGIAALKNAETGEDWLRFMQGQADISNEWALEDRERYAKVFRPLEDKFIKETKNWASPERQALMAREARADVINNAAVQEAARRRQMTAMGVNPNSGRFAGIDRAAGAETALAAAGAENIARNTVRREALALKGDAINLGRGLPSQALGALSATNQAANSGFSGAMQGYSNQANILQNQDNYRLNAWSMQQQANASNIGGIMSGLGSIAGLAFMSDEEKKTDKKPAKGLLDAVKGMPVEEWTYKPGEGDGGTHVGPYAQDFARETGKGDGKTINVIDAIGTTMGAVKELDAKVEKIAKAIDRRGAPTARKAGGRGLPSGTMRRVA